MSYMAWIRDWTVLGVNCIGYQNWGLIVDFKVDDHAMQSVFKPPTDSAAFADNVVAPQVICSKPQSDLCHNIPLGQ